MNQQTQMTAYDAINSIKSSFEDLASTHKQVVWKEECEFAHQAVGKNLNLQKCYPDSVMVAIKNVASVGLTLNPAHGFAYLIPESKKFGDNWVQECQLRISFQGLMKLATDSGAIKWVKAEIVREDDQFAYNGVNKEPTHTFNPFGDRAKKRPIGVYSVAKTSDDDYLVDFMDWDEVTKIRMKAKTKNVWDTWTEEMAKKAMIKRAYKQWPKTDKTSQLATAVAVMNQHEGNEEFGHTAEQLEKYLKYLNEGTPIEFSGFLDSVDEEVLMSLYASGEKGKKMEQKKRHGEKEHAGKKDIVCRVAMLNSGDEEQAEDAYEGLNEIETRIVKKAVG